MRPAQQEPVATVVHTCKPGDYATIHTTVALQKGQTVYTSPQPIKPWVGLTDDEIGCIADEYATLQSALRAIEAKLREKNA